MCGIGAVCASHMRGGCGGLNGLIYIWLHIRPTDGWVSVYERYMAGLVEFFQWQTLHWRQLWRHTLEMETRLRSSLTHETLQQQCRYAIVYIFHSTTRSAIWFLSLLKRLFGNIIGGYQNKMSITILIWFGNEWCGPALWCVCIGKKNINFSSMRIRLPVFFRWYIFFLFYFFFYFMIVI